MMNSPQAAIGIDIGGTNTRFALVRGDGVITKRHRTVTPGDRDGFLRQLGDGISLLRDEAKMAGWSVAGVGIGMPGLISRTGEILSSVNLPHCQGIDLVSRINSLVGLPVVVGNDANVAACGEHRFGAGRPYRSLLMITVGTGIGGGLILDNRLWEGAQGFAGEFGHITVEPMGVPCPCGNRGCVEMYASATAIAEVARRCGAFAGGEPDTGSLALAAAAGDRQAVEIFAAAGRALGIAAAAVVNLLNIEVIVVGGGVAASFHLFAAAMDDEMRSRAFRPAVGPVRIMKGELGDDAGLLGAAALALQEVFR